MNIQRVILIIAAVCFIMFIITIGWVIYFGDYIVQFPNNYRYFTSPIGVIIELELKKEDTPRIEKINDRGLPIPRVGPNVDGYRVYDEIIIGHVARLSKEYDYSEEGTPGYFIINTETDVVYKGLNKEQWIKKLKNYKITKEPILFRPSRLDKYNGRNKPE